MDPHERRWVIGGGIVAIIGTVGCVLATTLPRAPGNPLEGGAFVVFLAVAVVGLALIVAAGARDALSASGSGARRLDLTRLDALTESPRGRPPSSSRCAPSTGTPTRILCTALDMRWPCKPGPR